MKNKSLLMAFGNTVPYAIVPLIFLINFNTPRDFEHNFANGIVLSFSKDFISLIAIGIFIGLRNPRSTIAIFKTKAGLLAILGGIFGGPIGYTLYNAAFYEAGPTYGHIFTSLEPIFLVASGILLFKRKYKWQLWLGVCITIISISCLIFGESFSDKPTQSILIGALLGTMGSIAWAIETMLFDKAYSVKPKRFDGLDLIYIKMVSSIFFSLSLMFPIGGAMTGHLSYGYERFGEILSTKEFLIRFLVAGVFVTIARILFFLSIERSGGVLVGVVYNMTIIFTPLIQLTFYGLFKDTSISSWMLKPDLDVYYQTVLWICFPFIVTGIMIVTRFRNKIIRNN